LDLAVCGTETLTTAKSICISTYVPASRPQDIFLHLPLDC